MSCTRTCSGRGSILDEEGSWARKCPDEELFWTKKYAERGGVQTGQCPDEEVSWTRKCHERGSVHAGQCPDEEESCTRKCQDGSVFRLGSVLDEEVLRPGGAQAKECPGRGSVWTGQFPDEEVCWIRKCSDGAVPGRGSVLDEKVSRRGGVQTTKCPDGAVSRRGSILDEQVSSRRSGRLLCGVRGSKRPENVVQVKPFQVSISICHVCCMECGVRFHTPRRDHMGMIGKDMCIGIHSSAEREFAAKTEGPEFDSQPSQAVRFFPK